MTVSPQWQAAAGLGTLVRLCLLLGGARPVPPLQSKEEERRGDRDRDRERGRGGKEEVQGQWG